jgi:class 3 adenylate cyclase
MPHPRPAVHRTIVVVDVEGFGAQRRIPDQVAVRNGLYRVLREAFCGANISWAECHHEDRGDGILILAPAELPKGVFVESLPHVLVEALRQHNSRHCPEKRIRLRMALHAGEVQYDDHGVTGPAINLAFRLLEAAPLKAALAESPGVLAVITSSWFFDEVVQHSDVINRYAYRPIQVTVKETDTVGWIHLPDCLLCETTRPATIAELRRHRFTYNGSGDEDGIRLGHAAEELAKTIYRQWSDEAAIRKLCQPQPLHLRWSTTDRPVATHPVAVLGDGAVSGDPVRLRGGLDDIATAFAQLPKRQLVVLGEPGAGKTVVAIVLTLGLLDHRREQGGPVPVLLSASSWDPRVEHLHTWVARRLVEDYSALGNTKLFGPGTATRLVAGGYIVPILDGLDELPASLRTVAIEAINRATVGEPLVVTCRSAEYQAAVVAGGTVVTTAAVVELEPVGVPEVIAFLSAGGVHGDTRWAPVFAHLRGCPDGHLAAALSSPLMVALARTVYTDPASDPMELLHPERFINRAALEEYLLDAFIPAAYTYHPPPPKQAQLRRTTLRDSPELAHTWLTFLAQYLHQRQTRDLSWWQLHHTLSWGTRLILGVLLGLASGLACGLGIGIGAGLPVGLAAGLAGGLTVGLLATPPLRPRQVNAVAQGRRRHVSQKFLAGLALGLATGVLIGISLGRGIVVGIAGGFLAGLVIGIMEWLDIPVDALRSPSPISVLRNDRTICAIEVLADFGLGLIAGLFIGPGVGLLTGAIMGLAVGVICGLTGKLFRMREKALSASAWGWFLVSRPWLALQGKLPWRLMRFLDDAHQRGVLRQVGAVYQFRHARLQDRLAHYSKPAQY